MRRLRALGVFIVDFVIGDDWWVAAGVTLGLAATYVLAHAAGVHAWWLVPALLAGLLPVSLWRGVRRS